MSNPHGAEAGEEGGYLDLFAVDRVEEAGLALVLYLPPRQLVLVVATPGGVEAHLARRSHLEALLAPWTWQQPSPRCGGERREEDAQLRQQPLCLANCAMVADIRRKEGEGGGCFAAAIDGTR